MNLDNFEKLQRDYKAVRETGKKLLELKEETEAALEYVVKGVDNIEMQKNI